MDRFNRQLSLFGIELIQRVAFRSFPHTQDAILSTGDNGSAIVTRGG